jgi:hypothetical protein
MTSSGARKSDGKLGIGKTRADASWEDCYGFDRFDAIRYACG